MRKDFIFDEYQIYEARARHADAVLLIAAILELKQAEEYLHLARELGLSVLFEVHDFAELEIALRVNAPVIGINNRNLKTLAIDLNTTFELKKKIPEDRTSCKRKRDKVPRGRIEAGSGGDRRDARRHVPDGIPGRRRCN